MNKIQLIIYIIHTNCHSLMCRIIMNEQVVFEGFIKYSLVFINCHVFYLLHRCAVLYTYMYTCTCTSGSTYELRKQILKYHISVRVQLLPSVFRPTILINVNKKYTYCTHRATVHVYSIFEGTPRIQYALYLRTV